LLHKLFTIFLKKEKKNVQKDDDERDTGTRAAISQIF
jgi:hypothetical protein